MSLQELSNQIIANEEIANKDLDEVPASVRGSWGARIVEAKSRLAVLKASYRDSLLANGVAIFLEGDAAKAAEFADLVHTENEGLKVDASALYQRLAEGVELTLAASTHRQWGTSQTHKLHLMLQEVMAELKVTALEMPSRTESPVLPTLADVQDHIRKIMRASNGDELNALYVEKQMIGDALTIRYMGSLAPTLIMNAGEDEKAALAAGFAKGSATVTLSSEDVVDKEFLIKTFKQVNKSIRKKQ